MGGGGGDGDSETTYRFAPYLEDKHKEFLNLSSDSVYNTIDKSPFRDHIPLDIDLGFFGSGYALASFPTLYDMYGKFMAGLDIDVLYNQIFGDTTDGKVVNDLVSAESERLSDELVETSFPRFETGMRDINSVISSSFVVGKAMMESSRVKAVSRFSAELRYRLLPLVNDRWKAHLDWNGNVTNTYMQLMKLYVSARMDMDNHNYQIAAKDTLWPFTVLEYQRAALGALTGAANVEKDVAGASTTQSVIGGALSGAAAGYMTTRTWQGAVVGGVLGAASGLLR